jgi:O-antigen/teichoic acid export membrane protein
MLALLVVLAPTVVPWLFGPEWEAAVLPTQILVGAGVSSLVIDTIGSAMQAAGRARALLAYGLAHFVFYISVVLVVSSYGLIATCWAAVGSHGVFLVVAYWMLPGRRESTLRCLARDLAPATVSCAGVFAAAVPAEVLIATADLPTIVHVAAVSLCAALGYLAVLRLLFAGSFRDLRALLARMVPTPLALAGRGLRRWPRAFAAGRS